MNRISRCDLLPEAISPGARGIRARKIYHVLSHKINPLLTKLVRSRWLDIGFVLHVFCVFMDLDFFSVLEHAEKELGQYPAILTSRLVNNA